MHTKNRILVLCTGNSCRSQMAEGYLRHFGGKGIDVRSAGIESHGLNPRAVNVMKEDGIDISGHTSDVIDDALIQWASLVITVCGHADQNCPALPDSVEKRHLPFDDPAKAIGSAAEIMLNFRAVRDQIRLEMLGVARELLQSSAA
ncbi:MAG: arsenate reductase ArsC [Candidatus Thiodiazotropha sp. (ex Dulcina madagascariensis)]|nr:arsenate reductase ArsC [Candidatus Thiodiazotropha sp. (ex Dulcina madagascariensis)]MCU7925045.1 arsenate reductase ArsC [Candidatus Thiodiazotropha sp. (ex Dulcina madagascariensis)]MCU7934925.1 arsenate reductase ArsC [Candidatus Thiodiazotropha sp. (ex Dulcina madagascariensis)]